MRLSRSGPGTPGENRIPRSNPVTLPARASQSPHATDRNERSFSRYACVHRPGVEARWHKLPVRHHGTDPQAEHAQLLLLPWPLRVRESDFRAVEGSVQRLAKEPFGFFEFAPEERLDLDLVDRMLVSRPEKRSAASMSSCCRRAPSTKSELDALEALLDRHGVGSTCKPGSAGAHRDRAASGAIRCISA